MIDGDHAEADLPAPDDEIVNELADKLAVEPGKRFVEQDERRLASEHAGQSDAACLSAGDERGGRVPQRGKLQTVPQGGDPLLLRCGGSQSFCNSEMNILTHSQVREEAGLLRHVAECAAMQRQRRRKKLLAVELNKAVI